MGATGVPKEEAAIANQDVKIFHVRYPSGSVRHSEKREVAENEGVILPLQFPPSPG